MPATGIELWGTVKGHSSGRAQQGHNRDTSIHELGRNLLVSGAESAPTFQWDTKPTESHLRACLRDVGWASLALPAWAVMKLLRLVLSLIGVSEHRWKGVPNDTVLCAADAERLLNVVKALKVGSLDKQALQHQPPLDHCGCSSSSQAVALVLHHLYNVITALEIVVAQQGVTLGNSERASMYSRLVKPLRKAFIQSKLGGVNHQDVLRDLRLAGKGYLVQVCRDVQHVKLGSQDLVQAYFFECLMLQSLGVGSMQTRELLHADLAKLQRIGSSVSCELRAFGSSMISSRRGSFSGGTLDHTVCRLARCLGRKVRKACCGEADGSSKEGTARSKLAVGNRDKGEETRKEDDDAHQTLQGVSAPGFFGAATVAAAFDSAADAALEATANTLGRLGSGEAASRALGMAKGGDDELQEEQREPGAEGRPASCTAAGSTASEGLAHVPLHHFKAGLQSPFAIGREGRISPAPSAPSAIPPLAPFPTPANPSTQAHSLPVAFPDAALNHGPWHQPLLRAPSSPQHARTVIPPSIPSRLGLPASAHSPTTHHRYTPAQTTSLPSPHSTRISVYPCHRTCACPPTSTSRVASLRSSCISLPTVCLPSCRSKLEKRQLVAPVRVVEMCSLVNLNPGMEFLEAQGSDSFVDHVKYMRSRSNVRPSAAKNEWLVQAMSINARMHTLVVSKQDGSDIQMPIYARSGAFAVHGRKPKALGLSALLAARDAAAAAAAAGSAAAAAPVASRAKDTTSSHILPNQRLHVSLEGHHSSTAAGDPPAIASHSTAAALRTHEQLHIPPQQQLSHHALKRLKQVGYGSLETLDPEIHIRSVCCIAQALPVVVAMLQQACTSQSCLASALESGAWLYVQQSLLSDRQETEGAYLQDTEGALALLSQRVAVRFVDGTPPQTILVDHNTDAITILLDVGLVPDNVLQCTPFPDIPETEQHAGEDGATLESRLALSNASSAPDNAFMSAGSVQHSIKQEERLLQRMQQQRLLQEEQEQQEHQIHLQQQQQRQWQQEHMQFKQIVDAAAKPKFQPSNNPLFSSGDQPEASPMNSQPMKHAQMYGEVPATPPQQQQDEHLDPWHRAAEEGENEDASLTTRPLLQGKSSSPIPCRSATKQSISARISKGLSQSLSRLKPHRHMVSPCTSPTHSGKHAEGQGNSRLMSCSAGSEALWWGKERNGRSGLDTRKAEESCEVCWGKGRNSCSSLPRDKSAAEGCGREANRRDCNAKYSSIKGGRSFRDGGLIGGHSSRSSSGRSSWECASLEHSGQQHSELRCAPLEQAWPPCAAAARAPRQPGAPSRNGRPVAEALQQPSSGTLLPLSCTSLPDSCTVPLKLGDHHPVVDQSSRQESLSSELPHNTQPSWQTGSTFWPVSPLALGGQECDAQLNWQNTSTFSVPPFSSLITKNSSIDGRDSNHPYVGLHLWPSSPAFQPSSACSMPPSTSLITKTSSIGGRDWNLPLVELNLWPSHPSFHSGSIPHLTNNTSTQTPPSPGFQLNSSNSGAFLPPNPPSQASTHTDALRHTLCMHHDATRHPPCINTNTMHHQSSPALRTQPQWDHFSGPNALATTTCRTSTTATNPLRQHTPSPFALNPTVASAHEQPDPSTTLHILACVDASTTATNTDLNPNPLDNSGATYPSTSPWSWQAPMTNTHPSNLLMEHASTSLGSKAQPFLSNHDGRAGEDRGACAWDTQPSLVPQDCSKEHSSTPAALPSHPGTDGKGIYATGGRDPGHPCPSAITNCHKRQKLLGRSFRLHTCLFNQGINIMQSLGTLKLRLRKEPSLQERVNLEGLQRLNAYAACANRSNGPALRELNHHYGPSSVRAVKDVRAISLVRQAVAELGGVRGVNCKSGKDRTALELAQSLSQDAVEAGQLSPHLQAALVRDLQAGLSYMQTGENNGQPSAYAFSETELMCLPPGWSPKWRLCGKVMS